MKLWDKGYDLDSRIEKFTVGRDKELDKMLAPFDIMGTMAHITMLSKQGMLGADELAVLLAELRKLYDSAVEGSFIIEEGVEDVHSQVETMLCRKLGDLGKKIHLGRSRNDQVLLDLKLFTRSAIERTALAVKALFEALQERSEELSDILLPGYTHMQLAMPSSFGLWLGAYAESLADDLALLRNAWEIADRNPLGAAAGYGSSAPLDRSLTTTLLGFEDLDYNSVYAMLGRGKFEWTVSLAYASISTTLGRFATDCCTFMGSNFAFISLPDKLTTGSSIMPHKKNPDVFELIRANCNMIRSLPSSLASIMTNLISGYFRDTQLLKEIYLPMFGRMNDSLEIALYAVRTLSVRKNIMDDPAYLPAFTVEKVNRMVSSGVPFRDAYRKVGEEVMNGSFSFEAERSVKALGHTHEGSMGKLCNDRTAFRFEKIFASFPFGKVSQATTDLLKG